MPIPVSRRLDFSEIPLVDVGRLVSGSDDAATIAALGRACTDVGFVYVKNHGVPGRLIDDLVEQAARFFAQPMDEKLPISVNPRMRGYLPLNWTSNKAFGETTSGKSAQEGFWIGRERPLDSTNPLQGPNVWPAALPELQPAMLAYFDAIEPLSHVLLRAFALALDCDRTFFESRFSAPQSRLKLNHYPPQPVDDEGPIGVRGHVDSGAFTILWQDDNGGLQVQTKSGDWVSAPPIHGTFVINLGNVMQIWTNGRFSSTPHRVVNASGNDRYSVPLFVNPNYDAVIEPLLGEPDGALQPQRYSDYQQKEWREIFPISQLTISS